MANNSARRNCKDLMNNSLDWKERPESGVEGIYVIKEDDLVIYVGRSQDIRARLNSHFAGSGDQPIDEYIATRGQLYRDRHFTINWVRDDRQRCTEHFYVDIIEELQNRWPKFNMQGGDSC